MADSAAADEFSFNDSFHRDEPAPSPTSSEAGPVLEEISAFMAELERVQASAIDSFPMPKPLRERLDLLRGRIRKSQGRVKAQLSGLNKLKRKVITGNPNKRVRDFMKEEPVVKTIDKISFTAGVTTMLLIEFVMTVMPERFGLFYCTLLIPLLIARYYLYRQDKYQYFLADFCYFVNWLSMLTVLLPDHFNHTSQRIVFVMANGPLAWAIVAWRNSLVFHSLDKTTSIYIHALPMALSYTWRWQVGGTERLSAQGLSLVEWWGYPMAYYIAWQVFYLWYTEVLNAKHLKSDHDLATSLRYLARSSGPFPGSVKWICRRISLMAKDEDFDSETLKTKLIFVFAQLLFTVSTVLPCKLFYDYQIVHILFIATIFLGSLWNGASYYVHVFSKRYALKFSKALEAQRLSQEAAGAKAD